MTLWRIRHGFDTTVEAATEEEARNIGEQAYEQFMMDEPEPLVVERFRSTVFDLGPEAIRQHFEGCGDDPEDLTDEDLAEAADGIVGNPGDFFWEVFHDLCEKVVEQGHATKAEREKKAVTPPAPA